MFNRPFFLLIALLFLSETVPAQQPPINWAKRYEQAQDLYHENKADEAVAMGKQTLELAQKPPIDQDPQIALNAQYELSQLYLLRHDFPDAEKLLSQNLQNAERTYGPTDARTARFLYDLGWFYSNLTNYAKAEPLFLRALQINEKTVGHRHFQTAYGLNSLGVLNENRGDYPQAEKYFLEALSIQIEKLGPDVLVTATTMNNLATLYWSQSDYLRAKKFFAQALTIRERLTGRGSLLTATTVNNLALVYLGMGDYERAEAFFWRALRIREQKLGVANPMTLTTVDHLGLLYYDLKDFPAAESFLQRAAQAREKIIGPDQPDTARAIFHLACLYDAMGQYDRAQPLHERALDIRLRTLGATHPETAGSYSFLARHYHLMGQLDKAAPLYQKALDAQKSAVESNHPDRLKTLENFACLQLDLKNPQQAAKLAGEASAIREHQLQNLFVFTLEKQRIDFQKTLNFYNLPATLGNPEEIARVVYRTKGAVLDSMMEDRLAATATKDPKTLELIEKLRSLSINAHNREDLQQQAEHLQAEIGERLNSGRALRRALQVTPAAIAAAIPADSVMLEFIRYNAYKKNLQSTPSYGVLIQSKNQPLRWVPLGPAAPIEAQVNLYRKYVRHHVRESAIENVLIRLYEQLWQPISFQLPAGCQRVILCPDAELNSISFATLLTPDNRFLCEKLAVEYVSSARDLLSGPHDLISTNGKLIIFAAPEFRTKTKRIVSANSTDLPPLPGTQKEAAFLQKEMPSKGFSVETFLGPNASKQKLTSLSSPTILHLATHGFQWDKRTVLALAGAQNTIDSWQRNEVPPTADDGILTAEEVSGLNLQGTWLVVLSACDTGTGQLQAGEGVLGLRRGFLLAGAQNLLITLWPVEDTDTASFMEFFYSEAIQNRNAARALSQVQTRRLTQLRREKGAWQAVRAAGPFTLNY